MDLRGVVHLAVVHSPHDLQPHVQVVFIPWWWAPAWVPRASRPNLVVGSLLDDMRSFQIMFPGLKLNLMLFSAWNNKVSKPMYSGCTSRLSEALHGWGSWADCQTFLKLWSAVTEKSLQIPWPAAAATICSYCLIIPLHEFPRFEIVLNDHFVDTKWSTQDWPCSESWWNLRIYQIAHPETALAHYVENSHPADLPL